MEGGAMCWMHGTGKAVAQITERTSLWDKAMGLPNKLVVGEEGKVAGSLAVGLIDWQTAGMITRHAGGGSSSAFAAWPDAMASLQHVRVLTGWTAQNRQDV